MAEKAEQLGSGSLGEEDPELADLCIVDDEDFDPLEDEVRVDFALRGVSPTDEMVADEMARRAIEAAEKKAAAESQKPADPRDDKPAGPNVAADSKDALAGGVADEASTPPSNTGTGKGAESGDEEYKEDEDFVSEGSVGDLGDMDDVASIGSSQLSIDVNTPEKRVRATGKGGDNKNKGRDDDADDKKKQTDENDDQAKTGNDDGDGDNGGDDNASSFSDDNAADLALLVDPCLASLQTGSGGGAPVSCCFIDGGAAVVGTSLGSVLAFAPKKSATGSFAARPSVIVAAREKAGAQASITGMCAVMKSRCVVLGRADGSLELYAPPRGAAADGGGDGAWDLIGHPLREHKGPVRSIAAWHPEGAGVGEELIISGADDGTVLVTTADVLSGLAVRDRLVGHAAAVSCVAVPQSQYHDDPHYVTGSVDGLALSWSVRTGLSVATFRGHEGPVTGAVVFPGGSRVATCSHDNSIRVWDPATAVELDCIVGLVKCTSLAPLRPPARESDDDRDGAIAGILGDGSGDGDGDSRSSRGFALVVSAGDRATLIDAVTLAPLFTFAASGPVTRVAPSVGGDALCTLSPVAAGSGTNLATVQVWSTATASLCLESRLPGHTDDINTCHATENLAVTGGSDGRVRVWKLPKSHGQSSTLSADDDDIIIDARLDLDAGSDVWTARLSRDESLVAAATESGDVVLWSAEDGRETARLAHPDVSVATAFSPDARTLATGGWDAYVRLFDVNPDGTVGSDGAARCQLGGHEGWINALSFDPRRGAALASVSDDGSMRVWDVPHAKVLVCHKTHAGAVLAVDHGGDVVATGSRDRMVHVHDLRDGAHSSKVFTLGGHAGAVSGVTLLSDNRFVLSSSLDKTVRLWDLRLLGAVAAFVGHTKAATSVAVGRNGKFALSTGRDPTTLLWRLPSYFLQ